jgi:hypothetical protein
MFGRYEPGHFFAGEDAKCQPDAAFAFLGGQMGVVFMRKELFDATPLLLISTWDGDEFSLARFVTAMDWWRDNRLRCGREQAEFTRQLKRLVSPYISEYNVQHGAGYLRGHLPPSLASLFHRTADGVGWLVMPSVQEMAEFNRQHRSRAKRRSH